LICLDNQRKYIWNVENALDLQHRAGVGQILDGGVNPASAVKHYFPGLENASSPSRPMIAHGPTNIRESALSHNTKNAHGN
jgi:hypothetical protein